MDSECFHDYGKKIGVGLSTKKSKIILFPENNFRIRSGTRKNSFTKFLRIKKQKINSWSKSQLIHLIPKRK